MLVRAGIAVVAAALVLAGCGDGDEREVSSPPPPPRAPTSEAPSPDVVPGPGSDALAAILRPGAVPEAVVYAEMNGVAPEEIVAHTVQERGGAPFEAEHFVDAYAWDPAAGVWAHVFEATSYEDPSVRPGAVLRGDEGINHTVPLLEAVDFHGDGTEEVVLAVQAFGASAGPLEVWVFSWLSEAFTVEFHRATERGGRLTVEDATLRLEAGKYLPGDPGCCPSKVETLVIGADPGTGTIGVVERSEADAQG